MNYILEKLESEMRKAVEDEYPLLNKNSIDEIVEYRLDSMCIWLVAKFNQENV